MKKFVRAAVLGPLAGYAATLVMEKASNFLYQHQTDSARQREEQLRQEMPTATLVRRVGELFDKKVDDDAASKLGMQAHYAFGAAGGPAAVALESRGLSPIAAGLAVGTGMWVFVDEGMNYVLGLTPPAPEWPLVTHLRALAVHLLYGAVLGGLMQISHPLSSD